MKTLIGKIVGTILSVSANMAMGPEGNMLLCVLVTQYNESRVFQPPSFRSVPSLVLVFHREKRHPSNSTQAYSDRSVRFTILES